MSKALAVLQELKESSDYWSEYDVPIGIHERIDEAIEELLVTDKPTITAMAVMPNGALVSNVYDAYEEGRKSAFGEDNE